jgi:guanine deaminase
LIVSRTIHFSDPSSKVLSIPALFHMATLGGASLCRLQGTIGNFLPGKEFDALMVLPKSPGMWVEQGEALASVFEKWLFTGDDRDLTDVWVRGRRVGGAR